MNFIRERINIDFTSLIMNQIQQDNIYIDQNDDKAVLKLINNVDNEKLKKLIRFYKGVFNSKPIFGPTLKATPPKLIPNHESKNIIQPSDDIQFIDEYLQELMQMNIIYKVDFSNTSSPIFCVPKPGNKKRVVINSVLANKNVILMNHVPVIIENMIQKLMEYKYFSVVDLSSAFYQVALDQNLAEVYTIKHISTSRDMTGYFRFRNLPMGAVNSPAILSKSVKTILAQHGNCFNYIDDIIIFSKSEEEHIEHLRELMRVLSDNRLLIHPEKCIFMKQEIKFLGYCKIRMKG